MVGTIWEFGCKGGILRGYEAELSFNGKKYPSNPTVSPAQQLTGNAKGNIVVPRSATGELPVGARHQPAFSWKELTDQCQRAAKDDGRMLLSDGMARRA
jgi:hypothetical protein